MATVEAHRLLYAEEEFALGRTIQTSLKKEDDLNKLLNPNIFLSEADYKSIKLGLSESRHAVHSATETLIWHNRNLVAKVADKLSSNQSQFLEYFDYGIEGLSKAALKYDPSREYRFSTYATWWVRQTIQQNSNKNRALLDVSRETKRKAELLQMRKDWWVQYQGKPLTDTEFTEMAGLKSGSLAFLRSLPRPVLSLDKIVASDKSQPGGATLLDFHTDPSQNTERQAFSNGLSELAIKEAFDAAKLTPRERLVVKLVVIDGLPLRDVGKRVIQVIPDFRKMRTRGGVPVKDKAIGPQQVYMIKKEGLRKLEQCREAIAILAESST